ncbi:molybdenum cofactor-independent xanthine hydroxylase subunit HpxD [Microbacterium sediminicola]|uniref:Molybdenum cofactor-independent xanthine hydroxylase subunit HpxD n=1 Tax=Microbacterium sediminicola TaxID=415210 RepID=A0ABN2IIV5_9MICO
MVDITPVLLDNDDPRLRRAWHPIGRSKDIGNEAWTTQLLGSPVSVRRAGTRAWQGHGEPADAADPIEILDDSAFEVCEQYGLVWAALEPPIAPIPDYPEWFDETYQSDVLTRQTHVAAGIVIDNFLDVTHFSYLHRQSFGRARPVTDDGYSIIARGDFVQLEHDAILQEGRRNSDGGFGERRIATYTFWPPYICHLQMYFPSDGARAAATIVCQPESATSTRVFVTVIVPRTDPGLDDQVTFSRQVLDEDLIIVSRMPDPRLCLTVRAEFHTRADRASVEMRRTLLDFLEECGLAQAADRQEVLA